MKYRKCLPALKWFSCDLRVLVRKLACPFGHPTQVSTQVPLAATCDYLRVRLARALQWVIFIPIRKDQNFLVNLFSYTTVHLGKTWNLWTCSLIYVYAIQPFILLYNKVSKVDWPELLWFYFKRRPNDPNIATQHIATVLGATCCVRLATLLRHVATYWLLLAQIWK